MNPEPENQEKPAKPPKTPQKSPVLSAVETSDVDDEFEAALGLIEPAATPSVEKKNVDNAAERLRIAQAALAELENSVALESKFGAAQTELTPEELAERSFRKMALFGTRAEKVAQERKAAADAYEAERREREREQREAEAAIRLDEENLQKKQTLNAMEGQREQRQAQRDLDLDLKPLPEDWRTKEYNLPVADEAYWIPFDAVYFCMECKLQFLSGSDPLTARYRCISCGQVYCQACCTLVGYSTQKKQLGKFNACKACVQTTMAVVEKLKHKGDKKDQLRRVIAEKVEAGGEHCLVIGCQENHRQHYCRHCRNKDSTHFSSACPKKKK